MKIRRLLGILTITACVATEAAAQGDQCVGTEAATQDELDPRLVYGDAPANLADQNVNLENVTVRKKSGNGMWVGYTSRRQIFVVPADPSFIEFVAIGGRVDLHGTLRKAPSASQAKLTFGMDMASARRLGGEQLYIEAWSITTAA
jgi:hypothetical protein